MTSLDQTDRIRSYNLFGETAEIPDVVHCETVQDRSQLHNWEFRPHRHARLHQVLLIADGGGQAHIDGQQVQMTPGMAINVPRGHVHGFSFQEGTQGWVVTLSSDLVDDCLREGEGLGSVMHVPATTTLTPDLRALAEQIFAEYGRRTFGRAHILRAMAALLIGLMARAVQSEQGQVDPGRDNPLFRRFETLIETEYRNRIPVADYAAQLAVSPTHLNRIVRQATGGSASTLINDRMLREARRLLIYTTLSAAEIGYELGFADPAHFSRVFSTGTGQPPRQFRKRMEEQT
ncbi:helix-turn-helix domain-containing protein [Phaeobacter marinintestinus]|uniref:helix-turn-helix domain-containing protein n=1 Tax=Falsiphaeobacter marinintestinus TaxID=1492905 RepID=UPI001FE805EA|nr:helix-turn-helix domain-containing protein [Phaeobacter marinintestinus]